VYLPRSEWSTPAENDPPPCFRQGDVVEMTWVHQEAVAVDGGVRYTTHIEPRLEDVVLVGTCCDLVIRPDKRKGVLVSPLRRPQKMIRNDKTAIDALRLFVRESRAMGLKQFPNLVPYDPYEEGGELQVIHLEALTLVPWHFLKTAKKKAELTTEARIDFRERLALHFTRNDPD
jgi:hypothetical protein